MTTPNRPPWRSIIRAAHNYTTAVSVFPAEWHCTTGLVGVINVPHLCHIDTACMRVERGERYWYFLADYAKCHTKS
jgi:hypothetical protein